MDRLTPPKQLLLDGNLVENGKRWMQNFTLYMVAAEYEEKDEKVKASLLLHCIGDKAKEIYNTLTFDAVGDNMNYEKIMEKFEAYLAPRKNITFSRYNFLIYRQEEGQDFNQYHTEMKRLSSDCELGTLHDELLRDMLIIGLTDK